MRAVPDVMTPEAFDHFSKLAYHLYAEPALSLKFPREYVAAVQTAVRNYYATTANIDLTSASANAPQSVS